MTNRLTIALLLTSCASALAQGPAGDEERRVEARVSFDAFASTAADIDDGAGDVSTAGGGGSVSVDFPAGKRGTFTLGAGIDWTMYDFGGAGAFGTEDPWNEIRTTTINTRYSRKTTDNWGWFVGGFASASGEDHADFGESTNYGGFAGATYAVNHEFAIAFGAGLQTRLEDDASFLPIINFNWNFAKDWTLGSESRGRGGGIKLSYDITETVTAFASGGFQFREFRLNDTGATPDGVGADRSFPLALGVRYEPVKEIEIGIRAGILAGREIELSDSEGVEIGDADVDATPFIAAELKFTF